MNSWFERVRKQLLEAESPLGVMADDRWGVTRALLGLRDPDQPLIFLDLRNVNCSDSLAVGNELSEAVTRGLGSAIFGLGVGSEYAFGALASFLPALEPLTFAVLATGDCGEVVHRLLGLATPQNRIIIHCVDGDEPPWSPLLAQRLDGRAFRVSSAEALDMYGTDHGAPDIEAAVRAGGGAVVQIEKILEGSRSRATSDDSPDQMEELLGQAHGASAVIDALIVRRRWREAFEYSVDHAPTRVLEVIDQAGNAYFEAGEFERFWRFLAEIPSWLFRHEQPMYWWFNAAISVNRWRGILPQVDTFLQRNEAPDLRALRATVEVTDRSLEEAERAHSARMSPDTARSLAFIQEFRGDLVKATRLYKEAIELAEAQARPRHAVGAAAGMAQTHSFAGSYERAQFWGTWALRQYQNYGLKEELLRLFVVSVAAYPRLLVGAVKSAKQVLDTVRVNELMLGIPSLEGVLSTLGDLAIIEGRYDEAIAYYEMNVDASPAAIFPSIANDLVHGLLQVGERTRAREIARQAMELAEIAPEIQRPLAQLSLGAVEVYTDWRTGEERLREALKVLGNRPMGPVNARAVLHLGASLVRRGRPDEARALVQDNARYLGELGDSGWLLQGGSGPEIAQLKALFRNDEPTWRMQFLGKRSLQGRDGEVQLSLRIAELIAVLASNPDGIRGEQLAVALYGDRANPSTLKATVSRARRIVPIEPLPYRITEPYVADFVKVMELLQEGKVQAALELYRGPLLPESEAPSVVELREHLEESLRQAVLASGDPDAMIDLANQQGDDLELWEETRRFLAPNDPRRPLANARIRRIRKRWRTDGP